MSRDVILKGKNATFNNITFSVNLIYTVFVYECDCTLSTVSGNDEEIQFRLSFQQQGKKMKM